MKYAITAILAIGAMALAAPASAQLVNGLSGPNNGHDAPIGTKAGGAVSTLQAPGERAAMAGAMRNEMDAKNMRPTTAPVALNTSVKTRIGMRSQTSIARNEPVTGNEFTRSRQRLNSDSE